MATSKPPPPSAGSWACRMCSSLNVSIAFPTCEMCHSNNGAVEVATTTIEWSCPRCTLDNDTSKTQCVACDSTLTIASTNKTTNEILGADRKLQRFSSRTVHSLLATEQQERDESEAKRRFDNVLSDCQKHHICFVDDEFPPADVSVGYKEKNVSQWLHIRHIVCRKENEQTPWTVTHNPQPSDIEQGHLGDCWLMAALALITLRPSMLSHILLTPTVNKEGVYLVRICHNGLWRTVLLDDCFPCTDSQDLVFAQARGKQLFGPLIEKACAKICGSYGMLKNGSMSEGLRLLTGAPSDRICLDVPDDDDNDNRDLLWTKLVSACETNLIMGASTGRADVSDAEYTGVHLHGNHVYSVQTAYALPTVGRFVRLRNPHGRSRYRDDRISSKTLETLQKVHEAEASAGSFWISWTAFRRFFGTLTICSYRDDLFDVRLEGKFTPHAAHFVQAYYFHLDRLSTITVSLFHQRSNRKRFYANHTQSFVLCDIVEQGQIGDRYAIVCSRRKAHTHWTGTLPKGSYVLIPFSASYWNQSEQKDDETRFTLVIHSFTQLDLVIVEESGKLLADSLIAAVMKNCRTPKERENCIFYKSKRMGDTSAFVVENMSRDQMLNVDLEITESNGIQSSRKSTKTLDCVPPNHRQLLVLTENIDENTSTTRLNHDYKYKYKHTLTERRPPNPKIPRADDIHAPRPISQLKTAGHRHV